MSRSLNCNSIILCYTIASLFIMALFELESSGSVPIPTFHFSINKSYVLLVVSIITVVFITIKSGFKCLRPNGVIIVLLIKCVYDLIPVLIGTVNADQTFWYHYSMILYMPVVYIIYRSYSEDMDSIFKLLSIFGILLVLQETLTVAINNYSFDSPNYKQFLRIPIAHSNIIAVVLLSIFIIRICNTYLGVKNLILTGIILIGILLTQSRGALIFLILWYVFILYKNKYGNVSRSVIFKIIVAFIAIVVVILLSSKLQYILFETSIDNPYFWSKATSGRTDLFLMAINIFYNNLWLGSGLGVIEYDLGTEIIDAGVHNILIDYLVQCGIIGTIIYSCAIFGVFKIGKSHYSKQDKALNLAIWSILIYSFMEVCYFNFPCLYLFWCYCGLYNKFLKLRS